MPNDVAQPTLASPPNRDSAIRNSQFAIRNWQVLLFFVVLTVGMTWPWALHMGEAINPFGDVVLQLAVLRWDAHALVTNPAGLFEAPFFYPYAHSIAFSEHLIGETLVVLPFLLVTGNPALAYNINVLLSFVLTGFFTYLLVRDLTNSRSAGLLAGVAFAFCPFRFMQMGHLHMLETQWFPFTLWALNRLRIDAATKGEGRKTKDGDLPSIDAPSIRNPPPLRGYPAIRNGIILALFGFVMMGLSSVYYTFFLVLAILLWFGWVGVSGLVGGEWRGWRVRRQTLLWVAAGLLVVGLVLLPVYLPYAQTSADLGVVRTTYELENWSAEWSYFGRVLLSNWLYAHILAPNMASGLGERELFFGIVPSFLAVLGLVWGRGRTRFYFALLGIFALLMTFGLSAHIPGTNIEAPLPYAFFYDWLPGFKALRVPVRFAALLDFSVYVLAGYGLAVVVRRLTDDGRRTTDHPVIRNPHPLRGYPAIRNVLAVVRRRSSVVAIVLTALVLVEFINPLDVSNRRDVTAQIATTEPYGWLARSENAGTILELPFNPDQADVQYMLFGTRHWQPILNGWSGFVPPGTVELSRAMAAFPNPSTISLLQGLEVRHVVVHLWQFPQAVQSALKARLDTTPQLQMVDQAGDNYVYSLAPDPWLRGLARQLGRDKAIWIGEARHGTMPTLEVLAYALNRMGVRWEQMGGNINIGYRALGQLPFGRFPDYALVPNDGKLSTSELTPVGLDFDTEMLTNPAVRILFSSIAGNIRTFDMTTEQSKHFSGLILNWQDNSNNPVTRVPAYYFLAFARSKAVIEEDGSLKDIILPPGVSLYSGSSSDNRNIPLPKSIEGDARLLRVELGSGRQSDNQLYTLTNLLPLDVTSSKTSDTLDTRMKSIAPSGNGDFTVTIDVYAEPWGTHPDGHFGSWSVVLPGDDAAHTYTFHLDPLAKTVTTERDGQPIETFSWVGPPTQGDFRASLVVSDKEGVIANVPLYTFTLTNSRLSDWQLEAQSLSITPVR